MNMASASVWCFVCDKGVEDWALSDKHIAQLSELRTALNPSPAPAAAPVVAATATGSGGRTAVAAAERRGTVVLFFTVVFVLSV